MVRSVSREEFCKSIEFAARCFIERFELALDRYAIKHPPAEHDACIRLGQQHEWEVQSEFSSNTTTRYRCKHCEAWGFRIWGPHRRSAKHKHPGPLPRIVPYKHPFDVAKYRRAVDRAEQDRVAEMKKRDREA